MRKNFSINPLINAVLVLLLTTTPANASTTCPTIDENTDTTQTLEDGEKCTVESIGVINTDNKSRAIDASGSRNTITNNGAISAKADDTSSVGGGSSSMVAILAGEEDKITNSGTISATGMISATGSLSSASMAAIDAGTGNMITNNSGGTISSNGSISGSGTASRTAISAVNNNTITNGGTISATARFSVWPGGTASVAAISVADENTITNSGTISATADDPISITSGGLASVASIAAISAVNKNKIINSGTISSSGTISATGSLASASIAAISLTGSDNTIINSGRIMSTGDTVAAIQINNGSSGNTIINSGRISVTGADSYAINFDTGSSDNTLTLLPGSVIIGRINLLDNTNTLNVGNGLSVVLELDGTGAFKTGDIDEGLFVASDSHIAVVDSVSLTRMGLSVQDELLTDLTTGFFSTLPRGASSLLSATTDANGVSHNRRLWAQGFGTYRYLEGKGPAVNSSYHLTGGVVGGDLLTDDGRTYVGLFFGGASGNVAADFDSQDTAVNSFFGGVYGTKETESTVIDAALALGYSNFNNSERQVANSMVATGLETATMSSYGGFFISPQVTVSRSQQLFGWHIEPSMTLRYAGLFLHSFTESGTTMPLTVDSRGLHLGLARAQLAVPIIGQHGGRTRLTVRGGVEGRTLLAGDEVSGRLLGQDISFDPGGYDEAGVGFAGIAAQHKLSNDVVLFAGGEGLVETNGSYRVYAQAGLRY